MWHLGLRKEKDFIALIIVFVLLSIAVTLIANECGFVSCPAEPLDSPAVIDQFETY